MNRQEVVDRFDFDNQRVFNQQINNVALCELNALVMQRQGDLAVISDSTKLQLVARACVVARFEQTRT